jgi:hypothetical protein
MNNATHTAVLTQAADGTLCPAYHHLSSLCLQSITTIHSALPVLNPLAFSSLSGYQMVISPSLNMQCPHSGPLAHTQAPSTLHWLAHHPSSQPLTYTFPLSIPCWTFLLDLLTLNEGSMFLQNIENHSPNNTVSCLTSTTHPTTQHHVSEDPNSLFLTRQSSCFSSSSTSPPLPFP